MATTKNLGLVNVLEGENFDIDVFNGNNNKVDTFAGTVEKRKVLYSNANGSNKTIALNDSAANFRAIEIKCRTNDGNDLPTVTTSNGRKINISGSFVGTNDAFIKSADAVVSGTSITISSNREFSCATSTVRPVSPIFILSVVGVK